MKRFKMTAALTAFVTAGALGLPMTAEAQRGVRVSCGRGQTAMVHTSSGGYIVQCVDGGYIAPSPQRVVYVPRERPRFVYVERPRRSWKKSAAIIGGSAALGAGAGKVVGGSAKRGAVVGGIGGVVYDLATRDRRR
jgi:hypothetical protein